MRSFFSIFSGPIFRAMPVSVFCAMPVQFFRSMSFVVLITMACLSSSNAAAQTPSTAAQTPIAKNDANAPNYNPSLNPGIIPAPQMIEMSPRGGHSNVKKQVSRQNLSLPAEGYKIIFDKKQFIFEYADQLGFRHGFSTWMQLKNLYPTGKIPCMTITDYPRFRYRGMHLDVSRHFFEAPFLYKYANIAANYKFNVIHLHLTDDQGWRFESKLYPKLNSVSAYRTGTQTGPYALQQFDTLSYGGYYTQSELAMFAEIVLRDLGITVIPEIEMPGHGGAAGAAGTAVSS
jgi:hypothetical protein